MESNIKPDISIVKTIVTSIVTLFVIMSLYAGFTVDVGAGFKGSDTLANPVESFYLIGLYLGVLVQLTLHYYFTFKHWILVNVFYYSYLIFVFLAAGLLSLMSSI